jgi:hypothetical protein
MFIRQWPVKYGIRTIGFATYVNVAYVYGEHVHGCISELRGEAEFELLTGFLGEEVAKMDARNLQFYLLFVFIIWGAAATYITKREAMARWGVAGE